MTAGFLRGLFIVAFVAIASSFPGVGQADGAKPLRVTGFIQQGGPYRSTLVREEGGPDVARLEAVFTRAQALLAPLRLPITLSTDATVIVSHDYDLYLTNIRRAFLARGVDPTELDRLHGVDRLVRSLFFRTKAESDPRMHDNPATARLYAPHIGIHFVGDINALAGTQHLVNERAIGWYIPMAW
jgi:hypothetical protein